MSSSSLSFTIWVAVKPIIKMMAIAAGGAYYAHAGFLTPEACKGCAAIVLNFLLPCLIFDTVITSFGGNMSAVLLIIITAAFYQVMGLTFGFLVRWFTPVPKGWRDGVVAAGAFYNWGDLVIAYISSLGYNSPFNGADDISKGTAYSAIFMVVQMLSLYNLGGFQLIRGDFIHKEHSDLEKAGRIAKSTASAVSSKVHHTADAISRGVTTVRRRTSVPSTQRPKLQVSTEECNEDQTFDAATSNAPRVSWKNINNQLPSPVEEDHELHDLSESQAQTAVNSRAPSHHAPSIKETTIPEESEETNGQSKRKGWRKVWRFISPFINAPSLSLIASLVIANVSILRALFVKTSGVSIPNAPDNKPPLNFVMDIASFGGQAVPVMGMVLLGAALSKLSLGNLSKGFWKTALAMALLKLVVGSIIGIIWTTQVAPRTGMLGESGNAMLKFVMIMSAGVPSATAQVYITNLFAPTGPGSEKNPGVSSLSACYLSEYIVMLPALATLVSYTMLKVL